ncbi:MAG: tetratricopeptide repeat protein, partial [Reichenbachiella sp.]
LLTMSLKYYEKMQNVDKQAQILTNIGNLYYHQANYADAEPYYLKSLKFQEKLGNSRAMGTNLFNLGLIYRNRGEFYKALNYFYQAVDVTEKLGIVFTASIYVQIANVQRELGEYDQGLDYLQKAIKIYEEASHDLDAAKTLMEVGLLYIEQKQLKKAEGYYHQVLKIMKNYDDHCYGWEALYNITNVKLQSNELDSAQYYAQKGLQRSEKCNDPRLGAACLVSLGKVEQQRGNLRSGLRYFTQALHLARETGKRDTRQNAEEGLYKVNKQLGDFRKALHYHEMFKATYDSLFNEENTSEIARLEAEHEFSQEKQQLLADQEKEEFILQNEIKRQRILQYTALGGVILFLLLFVSFYISYRRKKRANEVISSQNQKMEELSQFKDGLTHMIAHDMKNSLNTILGFSASEPFDKKMKGISQSGQVLLNLVTNMLDVQRFEEAEVFLDLKPCQVKDLVEEARLQVALLLQMKSLRLEIRVPDQLTIQADAEMIVRVLVNLLNNAIKYSKPGSLITLSIASTTENADSFCQISVTDEGEGVEADKLPYIFDKFWKDSSKAYGPIASTGLGLTFCKLAVEAHNGEIKVTSEAGKGTTFLVILPRETSGEVLTEEVQKTHYGGNEGALILDNERALLSKLATQLRTLEVYQVGEINALLQELEEAQVKSKWKRDIETAINQGDEAVYRELLEFIS